MFTRPRLYHPYRHPKPRPSPAGFRIADYFNRRRCFNLFRGLHAASPSSGPLNNPTNPDNDAAPTFCLADLFAKDFWLPKNSPAPAPDDDHRDETLDVKETTVPLQDPFPDPPNCKDKRGPKHLSLSSGDIRPNRRRAQLSKGKRDTARKRVFDRHERRLSRARASFSKLRREAETLLKPEKRNDEDRIFLEQLSKLEYSRELEHALEECRQQMDCAAAETTERRREHKARDKKAAKMWGKHQDAEALEEQKRKVEEFVRNEEERVKEHFRQLEEAGIRADEERRRAQEALERRMREEQERLFYLELLRNAREAEERRKREQEEHERQLREERERQQQDEKERLRKEENKRRFWETYNQYIRERRECFAREAREQEERERATREANERFARAHRDRYVREARERFERGERERAARAERERLAREHERFAREERERAAREEHERQARFFAEQARRAAQMDTQVQQQFALYEGKWNELRTSTSLPPIDVREMPWPVFGIVSSPDQITYQDVRTFLLHPQRPGVEGKTVRDKIKTEVLRFHPDKFNTRILPKIQPSQQTVAQAIAGAVARILTTIMMEDGQ